MFSTMDGIEQVSQYSEKNPTTEIRIVWNEIYLGKRYISIILLPFH